MFTYLLGNVYISEYGNSCIRKVTISTGIINTIVGTGTAGYSGDEGPATSARLYGFIGIIVDSAGEYGLLFFIDLHFHNILLIFQGNLFIADVDNNRIRKVTASTGVITTIAGTGASSYSGDNSAATAASLYSPMGVTVDSSGTLDHNYNLAIN